jgi:hypothetical protein
MKKAIIYGTIFLLIVISLRACYLSAFCEYKSVLVLPRMEERQIKLDDSLYIYPYANIEEGDRFVSCINFGTIKDSFKINSLDVTIRSIDNPGQLINLTHVLAYKEPVNPENIEYVRGNSFKDLPEQNRTMFPGKAWNTIIFRFVTNNIDTSKFYNIKITGTVLLKGEIINFEKEIKAKRIKKYVRIQMMT